jgi:ferredoxin-NADP reductase/ferredoxin
MSHFTFEGRVYPYREGETVLEALVRGGAPLTYSCRRGTCQACIVQLEGDVTATMLIQDRLPRARMDAGTFLACQTRAAPITLRRLAKNLLFVPARLLQKVQIAADVFQLRLEPPGSFMWYPGQFVSIRTPTGALRSYPITSVGPIDYWLQLYVHRRPEDDVATWLDEKLRVGQFVELQGPFGECHYTPTMVNQPLLLVSSGIGIGALSGVVRDAGLRGHRNTATLHHNVTGTGTSTLSSDLDALVGQHPQLTLRDYSGTRTQHDALAPANAAFALHTDLANHAIFLCGDEQMIEQSKALAHARGAGPDSVYTLVSDGFVCIS